MKGVVVAAVLAASLTAHAGERISKEDGGSLPPIAIGVNLPIRWDKSFGGSLYVGVAKNVAVDYSTAQQLITTAWNVFFAIVLTVSVFGWTGGKKLVGESYTDAKVKVAEQKTQRAEKKAEKKAARAQEEADGEGLLTRLRHREEEEEEQ